MKLASGYTHFWEMLESTGKKFKKKSSNFLLFYVEVYLSYGFGAELFRPFEIVNPICESHLCVL